MTTTIKTSRKHIILGAACFLLGASLMGTSAHANLDESAQSSTDTASFSEGYSLSTKATSPQSRAASGTKSGNFHHQTQNWPQVWINNIGTLLFDDLDGDGYHSGFSISIDVDSEYGDTEVYAKIYLEQSYTSAVLLHTTGQFSVYGTTLSDEYRVDTELRNNYVADYYNVSIDIHDAWTDALLDTANERGFSNLRQLPLESAEMNQYDEDFNQSNDTYLYDDNQYDDNQYDDNVGTSGVVVTEFAGMFHPALLLALITGLLIRRRKH